MEIETGSQNIKTPINLWAGTIWTHWRVLVIAGLCISCEITLRCISVNITDDKSPYEWLGAVIIRYTASLCHYELVVNINWTLCEQKHNIIYLHYPQNGNMPLGLTHHKQEITLVCIVSWNSNLIQILYSCSMFSIYNANDHSLTVGKMMLEKTYSQPVSNSLLMTIVWVVLYAND